MLSAYLASAQQSEGFLKRKWNDMIARYNIYFNAKQMFEKSTTDLFERQVDDFEDFLEVYPYGDLEEAKNMRAPMEEVMKKASKVIQTKPKSKWVDDAYFLIGQTHFFANDQFSAIEAFQFVYSKYNDPLIKDQAQLWVMKSYMRQYKYNDAEAILGLIRETPSDDKQIRAHTALTAGDLYVKQGKYQLAIDELTKGVKHVKDKQLRYRAHFLLGQLHLEMGSHEKASTHFLKVIKATSPYEYVFQANLGLTKATAQSGGKGIKSTRKSLKRMLKDDKNIDYFDQIYFELALLEFVEGNEQEGLNYLKMSSSNAGNNAQQRTKTYLFLADYYFDKAQYENSQLYYDSAVSVLPNDYPDYEAIRAKHAVLSSLIEGISTIAIQDSLLALSVLPRSELDQRIDKIIQAEKRAKELAEEEERMRRERDALNVGSTTGAVTASNSGGVFYFYNASMVGRGYNEFKRLWGNRTYGDWWRYTNKGVTEEVVIDTDTVQSDPLQYTADDDEEQQEALAGITEDRIKYYQDIPFSSTAKLIARKKIQAALLQVAKTYFDDLKEYQKGRKYLDRLLNDFPGSAEEAEGLFYMSKTETALKDSVSAATYAQRLADEYPNTVFNQVLNSKEIDETGESEEVIRLYADMLAAYQNDQPEEVIRIKQLVDKDHAGNSIQAKFDYLYTLFVGRTKGKEAYIEELMALTENYPGTEIANIAAYTLQLLTDEVRNSTVDLSMYQTEVKGAQSMVITGITEDVDKVKQELFEYNERFYPKTTLQIKSYEFGDRQMFYIKPFESVEQAMGYYADLNSNKVFLISSGLNALEFYPITDDNFKTLIKEQDEDTYKIFFNKYYPVGL